MRFWNAGGFFSSVKGHVIKWWQLVIQPVLKINNNGKVRQKDSQTTQMLQSQPKPSVTQDETVLQQAVSQKLEEPKQENPTNPKEIEIHNVESDFSMEKNSSVATEDPMEVLRRINQEKEEAHRKEIEKVKKKASEEARITAIMNANKVDVNAFIEAGKAAKEEIAAKKAEEDARRKLAEEKAKEVQQATAVKIMVEENLTTKNKQEDDLRRAQEIMDRLNREAAEDEAKKQAEIEAAKQEAKKQFG